MPIHRVLHLHELPADDLVVIADVRGVASGVHAVAHYRFGRPEPRQPELPRSAPIRTTDGQVVGAPIPLSK